MVIIKEVNLIMVENNEMATAPSDGFNCLLYKFTMTH